MSCPCILRQIDLVVIITLRLERGHLERPLVEVAYAQPLPLARSLPLHHPQIGDLKFGVGLASSISLDLMLIVCVEL